MNIDFIYAHTTDSGITRINEALLVKDPCIPLLPLDFKYKNFVDNTHLNLPDSNFFIQSFLHVVTETVYHYPSTFISEKTWKPISSKRPFVIVGPIGSLKNLQNLGFKTFGDFWDESYDTIADPVLRMTEIVKIIENICDKTINELQNICISMGDILQYNSDLFFNEFKEKQIEKLKNEIVLNLNR